MQFFQMIFVQYQEATLVNITTNRLRRILNIEKLLGSRWQIYVFAKTNYNLKIQIVSLTTDPNSFFFSPKVNGHILFLFKKIFARDPSLNNHSQSFSHVETVLPLKKHLVQFATQTFSLRPPSDLGRSTFVYTSIFTS